MMKKNYQEPALRVVKLQHKSCLLDASSTSVHEVSSNAGIGYGGGGSGIARGREFGYDEDE
jgi:hypothetical protein